MGRWERYNRWLERHSLALDTVSTAAFAVVAAGGAILEVGAITPGWWAVGWAMLVVAPLAWRRRNPVASVVAVYAAALLHVVLGQHILFPADAGVLVALYSVTVYGPRWAHRTAVVGAVVGCFLLAGTVMLATGQPDVVGAAALGLFGTVTSLAVWAAGLVKRARRDTLLAWRDRAERLEVERDQQAQIATAAERARIAREMHDIVAHSLSVVVAQADGGRYAAGSDPAAAARALGTIAETGRAALADMRRLLGVLRTEDGQGAAEAAPADGAVLTPQPAAVDIEGLVEQVRASGLSVSLVRMGTPRPLPPGAGLTAYRIAQESLTNVLKHAGPDPTVTVLVQWAPQSLAIEVIDDGRGAAAGGDGAGHGLLGMRERAAMFGGSVTAGPRAGGGFRVRAELPLPPAPSPAATMSVPQGQPAPPARLVPQEHP